MNDPRKETVEKLVERFVKQSERAGNKITETEARKIAAYAEKVNRRNNRG